MALMVAELLARLRADTRQFTYSMAAAARTSKETGAAIEGSALRSKAAFVGMALTAGVVIGKALDSFSQFQFAMQKVVGLAGRTQGEVNKATNALLNMTKTLPVNAKSLADALYFIESGGIHGAKALDLLKSAATASAAGLGETKQVAFSLVSVLNAYKNTTLTAAQATDALVAAAREGHLASEDMAKALGPVIGIASEAGVKMQEVAAAIAAASRQGVPVQRAMTGVRFLLASLIAPSTQASKFIQKVFGTVDELHAQLARPFPAGGLLAVLTKLKSGLSLEEFEKAIGGVRGSIAALALVGRNAQDVKGVFQRVFASAGSTQRAFDAVKNTFQVNAGLIANAANRMGIAIGKGLAPFVVLIGGAFKVLGVIMEHIGAPFVKFLTILMAVKAVRAIPDLLRAGWTAFAKAANLSTGSIARAGEETLSTEQIMQKAAVEMAASAREISLAWQQMAASIEASAAKAGAAVTGMAAKSAAVRPAPGFGGLAAGRGAPTSAAAQVGPAGAAMFSQGVAKAEQTTSKLGQTVAKVGAGIAAFATSDLAIAVVATVGFTLVMDQLSKQMTASDADAHNLGEALTQLGFGVRLTSGFFNTLTDQNKFLGDAFQEEAKKAGVLGQSLGTALGPTLKQTRQDILALGKSYLEMTNDAPTADTIQNIRDALAAHQGSQGAADVAPLVNYLQLFDTLKRSQTDIPAQVKAATEAFQTEQYSLKALASQFHVTPDVIQKGLSLVGESATDMMKSTKDVIEQWAQAVDILKLANASAVEVSATLGKFNTQIADQDSILGRFVTVTGTKIPKFYDQFNTALRGSRDDQLAFIDTVTQAYDEMQQNISGSLDGIAAAIDQFNNAPVQSSKALRNAFDDQVANMTQYQSDWQKVSQRAGANAGVLLRHLAELGLSGSDAMHFLAQSNKKDFGQIVKDSKFLDKTQQGLSATIMKKLVGSLKSLVRTLKDLFNFGTVRTLRGGGFLPQTPLEAMFGHQMGAEQQLQQQPAPTTPFAGVPILGPAFQVTNSILRGINDVGSTGNSILNAIISTLQSGIPVYPQNPNNPGGNPPPPYFYKPQLQHGMVVPGGMGGGDKVSAMLTSGEGVLPVSAMRKLGHKGFASLQHLAKGGVAGNKGFVFNDADATAFHLALLVAQAGGTAPKSSSSSSNQNQGLRFGYADPFRKAGGNIHPGRIDMGVDMYGSGPITAIGSGTVTYYSESTGWPGGTFIKYKLLTGAAKGNQVYVSENVHPVNSKLHVGSHINANTWLGHLNDASPHMETGWAEQAVNDLAYASQWYNEGEATKSGLNFSQFLHLLGGYSGWTYTNPNGPNGAGSKGHEVGGIPPGTPDWLKGAAGASTASKTAHVSGNSVTPDSILSQGNKLFDSLQQYAFNFGLKGARHGVYLGAYETLLHYALADSPGKNELGLIDKGFGIAHVPQAHMKELDQLHKMVQAYAKKNPIKDPLGSITKSLVYIGKALGVGSQQSQSFARYILDDLTLATENSSLRGAPGLGDALAAARKLAFTRKHLPNLALPHIGPKGGGNKGKSGGGKTPPVTGTPNQWLVKALSMRGITDLTSPSGQAWLKALQQTLDMESNGLPGVWSFKAVASGQWARGLTQMIPTTYNSYAKAGAKVPPNGYVANPGYHWADRYAGYSTWMQQHQASHASANASSHDFTGWDTSNIWNPVLNAYSSIGYMKANYGGPHAYAAGGMIHEPIVGRGINSGHMYSFGEKGSEMVTPMNRVGIRPSLPPEAIGGRGSKRFRIVGPVEVQMHGIDKGTIQNMVIELVEDVVNREIAAEEHHQRGMSRMSAYA